jgi:hypothetical protein
MKAFVMTILTKFQISCEQALNDLLLEKCRSVVSRSILGTNENYVKIDIGDVLIFIYKDACDFQGKNIDERFENYNGMTEDKIIENFLWRLDKYL